MTATINLTTVPDVVATVLLALRDRFSADDNRVALHHVIGEMARASFARGYEGQAIGAWARKCLPEIDALIAALDDSAVYGTTCVRCGGFDVECFCE